MKPTTLQTEEEFDLERIKHFISLPVRKKLQYIEDLQGFLQRTMPERSKKIWEKLKKEGF